MESFNKVQVSIGGENITLVSNESEDYIRRLASYIDGKIAEMSGAKGLHPAAKCLLAAVNIADELFKERAKAEIDFSNTDKLEITRLEALCADLRKALEDSSDDFMMSQDELAITQNHLEQSKSELEAALSELRKSQEENAALWADLAACRNELAQSKEYLELLEAELDEASKPAKAADDRIRPFKPQDASAKAR